MDKPRRNLLGFAASGALLPFAASQSAEAHAPRTERFQGLSVSIRWSARWEVAVPVEQKWIPGSAVAIEWMPLTQFTEQLEREMREAYEVG